MFYSIKKCKILWQVGLGEDDDCPESTIPALVSFPVTLIHYAVVTSLGTFSFLVSGTKKDILHFWLNMFIFISRRDWHQLKDHITTRKRRKSGASVTPTPTPRPSPPSSLSPQRALSLHILPPLPKKDRSNSLSPPPNAATIFSSHSSDNPSSRKSSPSSPTHLSPRDNDENDNLDIIDTLDNAESLTDIPLTDFPFASLPPFPENEEVPCGTPLSSSSSSSSSSTLSSCSSTSDHINIATNSPPLQMFATS